MESNTFPETSAHRYQIVKGNEVKQDEKKFQCQQCPKSFEKRKILIRHEQTHDPKVNCQTCHKKVSERYFKSHMKGHEKVQLRFLRSWFYDSTKLSSAHVEPSDRQKIQLHTMQSRIKQNQKLKSSSSITHNKSTAVPV
jgi:hypothetical protein